MSLVVLKRKSQTKYSKLSSKKPDFSINNPRRVGSHSNQVQTQTPMKGNVPRGHGSCCGHYPIVIHKSQYNNYDFHERVFNGDKANPGVSVKNNRASISSRNKWMKSTYPKYVVKKMGTYDYSEYYNRINGQNASRNTENVRKQCSENANCNKKSYANIVQNTYTPDYSEYLKTTFLNKNCLPTPNSKAPVPVPIQGNCKTSGDSGITDTEQGNCQ